MPSRRSSSSPQLGEGGFVPAAPEFVRGLRELCDRHGIVLVADEVQTGFGRTGRMFAMEHFDVEADLITVAKSIAAGLPLSGVIGRQAIMDHPHAGAIGGTYIGNPGRAGGSACRPRRVRGGGAPRACRRHWRRIRERMQGWQAAVTPRVGDVRGLGAMLAIELVEDPATKAPAPALASAVIDAALRARPDPPQGRRLRELHPRALPAHDHRRRARRRARRLGERAARRVCPL